jgi:hypothetical protein
MVSDLPAIVEKQREVAEDKLATLKKVFNIKISVFDNYSSLLEGRFVRSEELNKIFSLAQTKGRVLLSGRGASGKTTILYKLVNLAVEQKAAPFLVKLGRWDNLTSELWKTRSNDFRIALDFLLEHFGDPGCRLRDADMLPRGMRRLFLIDGLNETPGSIPDELLGICDAAAALIEDSSFVIADRLVRRKLGDEVRWGFTSPLPIGNDAKLEALGGIELPEKSMELASNPFYLNRALEGKLRDSPVSTLKGFIEEHGHLKPDELDAVSEAAFEIYVKNGSRSFAKTDFEDRVGAATTASLRAGGLLEDVGQGKCSFNHHWMHDFLASRYVAAHANLWSFNERHKTFNALTFDQNSFDAIAFTLELLKGQNKTEAFLRAVYDWNAYAAGYALAEVEDISWIAKSIRRVMYSNLAEKRFDRHERSAQRANDALLLSTDVDATAMRAMSSLDHLIEYVKSFPLLDGDIDMAWQKLFIILPKTPCPDEEIQSLSVEDSILGWTSANVVKRLIISNEQAEQIVQMAHEGSPVVRWRAAHVMGGFAKKGFVNALINLIDTDDNISVKYGSIRSLIEIASRSETIAKESIAKLTKRVPKIVEEPKLLSEIASSVFIAKSVIRKGWTETLLPLFYKIMDQRRNVEDVEKWSGISSELLAYEQAALRERG